MFNVIFIDVFLPCKIFWAPTVKIYWRSRWSRASKSSWGPRINGLSQCHTSNIDKAGITLHYVEVVRLRAVQRSQSWTIISLPIFIQHMIPQAQESEKEKAENKQKNVKWLFVYTVHWLYTYTYTMYIIHIHIQVRSHASWILPFSFILESSNIVLSFCTFIACADDGPLVRRLTNWVLSHQTTAACTTFSYSCIYKAYYQPILGQSFLKMIILSIQNLSNRFEFHEKY